MKIPLALVLVISGFIPCLLPAQAPSQRNAPRQTVKPAAFEPPHTFFEHFGAAQGVPGEVTAIVQDHRGYLWCAVKNKGLLRFDGLHFKPYINDPDNPASLPDNDIRDIIEDRNGMLWLATQTGVVRFNPARERFQYVPQRIQDGIWCLQEGSNGRIWVGTARSGLAYYEPRHDSIVPFLFAGMRDGYTGADLSDSFFDCFFYLAQEADGSLWAAATMHDKKDTPGRSALLHIDVVRKAALLYAPGAHLNIQNRWGGDQSNCFFDLKKRMFWIGSLGIGLLQFSVAGREWKQIIDDRALTGNKAENAQILSIQPLNDTIFWLGQSTGLAFLNIANGRFVALEPAPGRPGGSQEGRHKAIYRDRDGTCWFGVSRGLSRLDPYRQQFPVRSPLPPGFDAQAIAEYPPTGELFFASWDTDNFFRIIAWHPKTGKRRRAAQRLPFRANDFPSVHQIFVAPGGRVWVLLNRGIGWLDPNTLRLRFPDLPVANAPGVRTGRLWPRRITADEEGKLWMATFGTGLVRYDPKTGEFRRPPELPVCRDTRREYNLFLFSVFADENGKVFLGENGTGLEVWDKRVLPPFYRTTWFWTLCAGVFAALVYAIFRYRELQRLQQEKLRLRIARDLHDEMGSTLSSISILSEAALRNLQQDIDRARFGAIGERARQVMEAMSDIVWSVNPRNDSMANVLQRMKQFAVEILEPQGIALHFEADEAVAALNLPMEQRKDFYLLFKEAVNNAAKYSGAGDVWVTLRADDGRLTLEVRDNGRGFDVEQVKRGNGLWNMERRAERMGGRFLAESNVGTGTTIAAIITTPK